MATRRQLGQTGTVTGPPRETSPTAAGIIGTRGGAVPTGRVVLGGFLVAAAAVAVFASVLDRAKGHDQAYVVAARDLPAGSIVGPGDTTSEPMKLPAAAAALAFRDPVAVVGRNLTVPLHRGELVETSALAPTAPVLRPVSVVVDPAALVGLAPGERVDVLSVPSNPAAESSAPTTSSSATSSSATSSPGSGSPANVAVVMRGATLLAESRGASGLLPNSSAGTVVTLGVADLDEVEQVVSAAHSGSVVLVAATPADGAGPGPAGPRG